MPPVYQQRSVGVQVGASGPEVSSVETETEAPSFAESRVQTEQSLYEFYSVTAGEWVTRESVYDFDEEHLHAKNTPYDDDDPFVAPDGLGTVVGGDVLHDGTTLQGGNAMDDEEVEDVPPVPQTGSDGRLIPMDDSRWNTVIREGDKVLVSRHRPTGHRPRAGFSPIRPP
jgi:hypothetical protein